MWAKYNFNNFPIVKVEFDGVIEENKDFIDFINKWKRLYDEKEDFEFIFDTSGCGLVNPKYSFYMAFFIKNLKKKPKQYLKKSTIYIYHKCILYLLKMVFYIEKPVAPVHLVFKEKETNEIKKEEIINP